MKIGAPMGLARDVDEPKNRTRPRPNILMLQGGCPDEPETRSKRPRRKKYLQWLENFPDRCYVALALDCGSDRIFHFTKRVADAHNRANL
jgi:hypothetical protein